MGRSRVLLADAPVPQHPPKAEAGVNASRSQPSTRLAVALWLMLWAGHNTEMASVFEPDFPTGLMVLFHGLRSFLPFVAAFVAVVKMMKRGSVARSPLKGPMGLLAVYALIGVLCKLMTGLD